MFWPGYGEQVIEARRLEVLAQLRIDPLVRAEHHTDEQRAALTRRAKGERARDRRAQPVADASDPAPPADDTPRTARVKDDVNPASREPSPFVEAGLGPTRGDRARPEIEHGSLRRRATGRQLQKHALPNVDAVELRDGGRRPERERRSAHRTRDDRSCRRGSVDVADEKAPVELLHSDATPPQADASEGHRRQRQAQLRRNAKRRGCRCNHRHDGTGPWSNEPVREG